MNCGRIAHAYGRKGPTTALCGSRREYLPVPMSSEHVKCIRCLRAVETEPSKAVRERIEILNLEMRRLRQQERLEAELKAMPAPQPAPAPARAARRAPGR